MPEYRQSRERLFGLLISCPFIEPKPSCPLFELRDGDPRNAHQQAFREFGKDRLAEVLRHHDSCFTVRCPGNNYRGIA